MFPPQQKTEIKNPDWESFSLTHFFLFKFFRTRVAHRRVQQVHGGSAQAQSVHPVRGLFEIRHHARTAAGRPESGRREGAGLPGLRCWGPAGNEEDKTAWIKAEPVLFKIQLEFRLKIFSVYYLTATTDVTRFITLSCWFWFNEHSENQLLVLNLILLTERKTRSFMELRWILSDFPAEIRRVSAVNDPVIVTFSTNRAAETHVWTTDCPDMCEWNTERVLFTNTQLFLFWFTVKLEFNSPSQ